MKKLAAAVLALLVPTLAAAQQVEYYHLDALGSVRAVTDGNGAVITRHDYEPFGEEWNEPPSSDSRRFTGKERDPESSFDYFGARYYHFETARFSSVDPRLTVASNLKDPQLWNRYAYARGNPLTYIDPDGREVHFTDPHLERAVTDLRSSSTLIEATLALFEGPDAPTLLIARGDAGYDSDNRTPAIGAFDLLNSEEFTHDIKRIETEHGAVVSTYLFPTTGDYLKSARFEYAIIVVDDLVPARSRAEKDVLRHELGHAFFAGSNALNYLKTTADDKTHHPNGTLYNHDDRAPEATANRFEQLSRRR
jgi:RHS repeat-associated protein